MAYADDVTVVIKNQMEMDVLTNHLNLYELASGAKLNHDKTEGVWTGVESKKRDINIKVKGEIPKKVTSWSRILDRDVHYKHIISIPT